LSVDAQRADSNRVDCVPCVTLSDYKPFGQSEALLASKGHLKSISRKKNKGIIRTFVQKYYAQFILHPFIKTITIFSFLAFLFVGIHFATKLDVGLDQRQLLPEGSYVIDYMNAEEQHTSIGPAFYIVFHQFNYSDPHQQNKLCSLPG